MKRDDFTQHLGFDRELIIDNFAGGGGTSEGLELGMGRHVDIAINHDPQALAMHAVNHPFTLHLCESVWTIDPIAVTRNRPVALVWLSPDCKHFSKAKGSTPVTKEIRGLAWVTLRWAAKCKPRVIMLENVEEFVTWRPLILVDDKWRPDPAKKGKTFESFVRQLRAHGYVVDWRELRACDNGAPTIRRRFFMIARPDGLPIVWPEASHASPVSKEVLAGTLFPWKTAASCIDFQDPSRSIFGRKKALVPNTLRRVAKGAWRHVMCNPNPFLIDATGHTLGGSTVDSPVGGDHLSLVTPALAPFLNEHANSSNQRTMPADEPLRTICAQVKGGHFSVVAPLIVPLRGTSPSHTSTHAVQQPLSTVAASGTHHGLTAAHLVTIGYGEREGQAPRSQSIEAPLGTVVTTLKHAVVASHVMHLTHHGERSTTSMDGLLPTVTAAHRGELAFAAACFEQANGGFYDGDGRAADAPLTTITSSGSTQRLIVAYCVKCDVDPVQVVTLGKRGKRLVTHQRHGIVETVEVSGDSLAPAYRAQAKRCADLMHEYLPEQFPASVDMILIGGYALVDITLRMLKPRELYRAQDFRDTYIIEEIPDPSLLFIDGVQVPGDPRLLARIPLTKTAQVRMCGNSVSPAQSEALARSNFAHEHLIYGKQAA